MRTARGVNIHRQPQQFKLTTLFDFYQADPHVPYTLSVSNGILQTSVGYQQQSSYQRVSLPSRQYSNENQECSGRKSIGLFGDLLKNMKQNKNIHRMPPAQVPPKRPYKFYYQEFDKKQQSTSPNYRGASAKKVKEKATGITDLKAFRQAQKRPKEIQNANIMNRLPFKEALIKNSEEKKNAESRRQKSPVAVDFSFDDMSEQKIDSKMDKIEISIIDKEKEEIVAKNPQQKDEFIIPRILVHEPQKRHITENIKIPEQKQQVIEIINETKKEEISVKGAIATESKIYQNGPKQENKDINIDFDLDINFI